MRRIFLAFTLTLLPLLAQASVVRSVLPDAELRGTATFRFIGLPIYQARLYTRSGERLNWNEDFGLELTYMRNLTEYDLVESTMREFKRTGSVPPVRDQLKRCYKDVRTGDRYTAVSQGPDRVNLWLNGTRICTLSHPQIKARFMGIFLGDNTRSGSFTRKLRGE